MAEDEYTRRMRLAILIASGTLPKDAIQDDAKEYFDKLSDCGDCPVHEKCLICRENE
jgi:hypothetical protein